MFHKSESSNQDKIFVYFDYSAGLNVCMKMKHAVWQLCSQKYEWFESISGDFSFVICFKLEMCDVLNS